MESVLFLKTRNYKAMRQFNFLLLFIALFLTSSAYAKVTYKEKKFEDAHLNTVKGFLYELTHHGNAQNLPNIKVFLPKVTRAIVWLTKVHNDPKTFKLESFKTEEAQIMKEAIINISDIASGKYPDFPIEQALARWYELGAQVVIEYKEKSVNNPLTGKVEKQVNWKFDLLSKKNKTKNLIFIHETPNPVTLLIF